MINTKQNKNGEIFKVAGDWTSQLKKLKEKFTQQAGSDLKYEADKGNKLPNEIRNKLNKNCEEGINNIKKDTSEKANASPIK